MPAPAVIALLASALALAPGPLFEHALRPLRVSPPPGLPSLAAEECGACHAAAYRTWRASRHAAAYDNRLFQASYRKEPRAWCRNCHAPLGARVALSEGVSCAACHVRDGAVLSARAPTPQALRAHPVRVAPLLAESELCGACHQFNFPRHGAPFAYGDQPMQDTLAEWQSARSDKPCQSCHMGDAGHLMPGAHDADLLSRSLSATVRALPDGEVVVTLRARGAAHRVPTGDPFRRLQLDLCEDAPCEAIIDRVTFGRRFRRTPTSWALVADDTLPPPGAGGESQVERRLRPEARPAFFRLRYRYAAPGTEPDLPPEDRALELQRGAVVTGREQAF